MRYFVEPATRWQVQRYHVLHGNAVVRIQASRPDGIEVPRPGNVVYRLPQHQANGAPKRRAMAMYNVDLVRPTTRATKRCARCKENLPASAFQACRGGLHSYCRACMQRYQRQRRTGALARGNDA